jgi:Hg(II)-responsive transcriptional regulator
MTHLTIGRAARAANVHVETIRFYERRGLIAQPSRPEGGGARRYDLATVERIRFVRQAQDIGFSLREIAELLSLRADPGADCADVRARAIEKREEVQVKLDRLARIRDALDELIARCPGGGDVKACTILEAVAAGDGFAEGSPAQRNSRDEAGRRSTSDAPVFCTIRTARLWPTSSRQSQEAASKRKKNAHDQHGRHRTIRPAG